MSLYLPSRLKPVIRPIMILGLRPSKTSGPSPNFSKTPGRKGSMTTSAWGTKDFINAIPEADFKSTATEDLWRVMRSFVGGGGFDGVFVWVTLGIARSIRRTDAPLSASRRPANGPEWLGQYEWSCELRGGRSSPGARPANSRTRIPVSAGGPAIMSSYGVNMNFFWRKELTSDNSYIVKRCRSSI